MNAVTACMPEDAKLPLTLRTEREAVAAALATVRRCPPEELRVVCIANTSDVVRLLVSHGCLPALEQRDDITTVEPGLHLGFDERGDLSYPVRLGGTH